MARAAALAALASALPLPGAVAAAQGVAASNVAVEAVSDERRRGISWSGGRPTLVASGNLALSDTLRASAAVAGLRGSARHGGADVAIDAALRYRLDLGPWLLSAGAGGHAFAGRRGLHYAELEAHAVHLIGPASIDLGASYAPRQRAIGGDNLYLSADLDLALPGTPWTLRAGGGRSSGTIGNAARAARLRPGGTYWDGRLAVEHVLGPLTLGGRVSTTSIGRRPAAPLLDDRHTGTRAVAYARVDLGL